MRTNQHLLNGLAIFTLGAAGCVGAPSDRGTPEDVGAAREAFTDSGLTVGTGTVADEHCRLPSSLLTRYPSGTQIRLINPNNDPITVGLCTVDDDASSGADIEMNQTYLARRLDVAANILSVTNIEITLLRDGVDAEAEVLRVDHTGEIVDDQQVFVKLALRVHLPGEAPREVSIRHLLGPMDGLRLSPGKRIRVKVDPKRPSRVIPA